MRKKRTEACFSTQHGVVELPTKHLFRAARSLSRKVFSRVGGCVLRAFFPQAAAFQSPCPSLACLELARRLRRGAHSACSSLRVVFGVAARFGACVLVIELGSTPKRRPCMFARPPVVTGKVTASEERRRCRLRFFVLILGAGVPTFTWDARRCAPGSLFRVLCSPVCFVPYFL